MSQQSRGTPVLKQESFNSVNPQMVFNQQPQQPQRRPSQQQQPQPQRPQQSRPNPMMFMPSSSSALQHQYINDDSLAGSSTFADNELAESLGYGNLNVDPFTYSNHSNLDFDNDGRNTSGNGVGHRASASARGKSFPMRLQTQNQLYAASPTDFQSFSPEFGSPGPIPFNRQARGPGQLTSMSMPQFGGQNHSAIMIGAGSLTGSPSTPGFIGNSFGGYGDIDGADIAKQLAMKEKRQKRRESHNAVERRRRDNINEKIQELASIIPDEFMTQSFGGHGSSPLSASPATHHAADGTIKHNKGVILRKSVDYIRSLQDVVKDTQRRAKRLEEEVKRLGGDPKLVDQDEPLGGGAGGRRGSSMSNVEDDENWLDEALVSEESPGMMMD